MPEKIEILNYLKELKPELYENGLVSLGLFGSIAKGKQTNSSDIDIVYESTDKFCLKYQGWNAFTYLNDNLRNKVSQKFHLHVDMFDLNSDSLFGENIRKEAIYV
ncbi:MAG: nucleotidyltransferase domain-containing protein [Arcobacter sp.]|nr:nucleotidyltransferase domain-containing protein [Arcobacter sp.]